MTLLLVISTAAFCLLNFLSLFNRKKVWARGTYRWCINIVLLILGITLLALHRPSDEYIGAFFASLTAPCLYSVLDYGFTKLSIFINNRDYYLFIRGSDDLKDFRLKFKALDTIISFIMLYSNIGLIIYIISLAKAFR